MRLVKAGARIVYYARYWYVHVAVSLSIGPPLPGRACLAALRWLPMKILVNIGQESYFQILGANGVFAGLWLRKAIMGATPIHLATQTRQGYWKRFSGFRNHLLEAVAA
jgi:hypothetical protein